MDCTRKNEKSWIKNLNKQAERNLRFSYILCGKNYLHTFHVKHYGAYGGWVGGEVCPLWGGGGILTLVNSQQFGFYWNSGKLNFSNKGGPYFFRVRVLKKFWKKNFKIFQILYSVSIYFGIFSFPLLLVF